MTTNRLFPVTTPCSILSLIASTHLVFMQATCAAQTVAQADDTTPASSTTPTTRVETPNSQNREIIKEPHEMRARIQQLEAQLKAQSASDTAMTQSAIVQNASLSVSSTARTAVQQQPALVEKKPAEPFAFADFTWLNGNPRTKTPALNTLFFTPEIRADVDYIYDFNHPSDNTIGGSSEVFRANEFHVTQLGVGGDFHFDNVQARLMTQFGLYSQTTPRNDASPARGQWNLADAYRYVSEAYGGYHFNKMHGINVQAGIFMSYIGRFNHRPGVGGQILWRPNGKWSFVGNQYALGRDTLGVPGRSRFHTDDSVQYKYYDNPDGAISKGAFSVTLDLGCESGGGVSCFGIGKNGPKQSFIGFMVYNRLWFHKDLLRRRWAAAPSTTPAAILCCCRQSMGPLHFPGLRTLPKTREIRSKPGMVRPHSTTCPASTSRLGGNTITARPTCRTSPAPAASRLLVATLDRLARLCLAFSLTCASVRIG